MKLLDLDGLADKGIQFSDTHIWRLVRAGDFPKPIKVGNRNHWVETEIDRQAGPARLRPGDLIQNF